MSDSDHRCEYCGAKTYEDTVKMCLWHEQQPIIIEDIPARVCEGCFEQFYDDVTRFRIESVKRAGFPIEQAEYIANVPVFSLDRFRQFSNSPSYPQEDQSHETV